MLTKLPLDNSSDEGYVVEVASHNGLVNGLLNQLAIQVGTELHAQLVEKRKLRLGLGLEIAKTMIRVGLENNKNYNKV